MPLVWAHAEYVKLCRSLRDGRVFDMPPQTVQRYLVEKTVSSRSIWRFNHKIGTLAAGRTLRIETLAPAVVHWSADRWQSTQDLATRDTGVGLYVADLPAETLAAAEDIRFTFYWPGATRWEGRDFTVAVTGRR